MYNLSQLYFYRPLFMLQLIAAELLFAFRLKRRKYFWLRALAAVIVCVGASFAVPIVTFDTLYGSFMFLLMFAVTVGTMFFVYDTSFKNIIFCAVAGFTVQHIAQEAYELFNSALGLTNNASFDFYSSSMETGGDSQGASLIPGKYWFSLVIYFQMYFLLYCTAYQLFAKRMGKTDIFRLSSKMLLIIVGMFILIDIVFGAIIIWTLPENADRISVSMLHIYNIVCCIIALVILFEVPRRKQAENDLMVLKQLQHRERQQYLVSKESVDLINLKCHDFKYHLRTLQKNENVGSGEIAELEKLIEIYDSTYTTASEALNVILMEKSLVCKKMSIKLSCIVDAARLDFMADADIYVLFGNIIDNSIEAVKMLSEDRRTIGFSIKRVGGFIAINIYNSYAGDLNFENGLPTTTKSDKAYHGFGMKSIKRIVEKYNGNLRISSKKQIFDLKIMFSANAVESE